MIEEIENKNAAIVNSYIAAWGQHNKAALSDLFADNVVVVIPLSPSGELEPWYIYDGKERVEFYHSKVMEDFSQIAFLNLIITLGTDHETVYFEAQGDFRRRKDNRPYLNIYVFKFKIIEGLITAITLYANPETYVKLMG